MRNTIKTNKVAAAPHILSQAIEANGFVFVSGQIGADLDWKLVDGGVEEECKKAMSNVGGILQASGLNFNDIVKVTLYVTDISQAKAVNDVYSTFFTAPLPAREMVEVSALPLGALVEVSVIAAK